MRSSVCYKKSHERRPSLWIWQDWWQHYDIWKQRGGPQRRIPSSSLWRLWTLLDLAQFRKAIYHPNFSVSVSVASIHEWFLFLCFLLSANSDKWFPFCQHLFQIMLPQRRGELQMCQKKPDWWTKRCPTVPQRRTHWIQGSVHGMLGTRYFLLPPSLRFHFFTVELDQHSI